MLSKNQRLTRKRIEYLFKKGKRQSTPSFAMTFTKNDQPFARFSVVVSTKIHPLAVNRNRLRRQCYEIIRTHLTHIPSNIDAIITVRSSTVKLPFEELSKRLIEALMTLKD
jgi:ribonuclease P protein component